MPIIKYGTRSITYSLHHADRKSLAIEVHPDLTVQVIAPTIAERKSIEEKLAKRANWILKQQQYFTQFLPRTPQREYVSGETHLYLGRRYLLVTRKSNDEAVKLIGGKLLVMYNDSSGGHRIYDLLVRWYSNHAERTFLRLHSEVTVQFSRLLQSSPPLDIRRMKNRWGSCTPKGRIILNPELIKASTNCIRYVLIHEMCHLIEPSHNSRFYELQSKMMPEWKYWKEKLELIMA